MMNFMEIKKKKRFLCQKKGKKIIQFWNSLEFFFVQKTKTFAQKKV